MRRVLRVFLAVPVLPVRVLLALHQRVPVRQGGHHTGRGPGAPAAALQVHRLQVTNVKYRPLSDTAHCQKREADH